MQVNASLTGPFPRSEALVRASRDLDRGRTTTEAVDQLYRSTEDELRQIEEQLSLAPWTGGYLRWADLFRPFAMHWSGFEVGPVTRWFETNTFYRQPILHAPPERVAGALAPWFPAANPAIPARRAKAILPGPFTFAGMLDNRSGETPEALIHRLGRLLAAEVSELRGLGYGSFQFQEPLLVTRPPSGPAAESTVAAYRSVAEAAGNSPSLVWTFFGDAEPVLPLLGRLRVSAVGIDLAETEPAALSGFPPGRGIGFGCLDPRTTLLEDPTEAAARVTAAVDLARPSGVWLGPGGPLDLLPWDAAVRKLSSLSATRDLLAPKHGGS